MTPKQILLPGISAPEFILSAVNLEKEVSVGGNSTQLAVIIFFGSKVTDDLANILADYQKRLPDYEASNAKISAVSDANLDDMRKLAAENQIEFPLISSRLINGVARRYGVVASGAILPTVFVVDREGLIRRVYSPEPDEGLPNPAMVLRAVNNLANIPNPSFVTEDDWRLGSPEAPIVIIEYGDYQCKHCREIFRVIKQLMPSYTNKVQFIFRHFPMRHAHPLAVLAAQAAEAAGSQGMFWKMHSILFEADNALEREKLMQYAREIGLDTEMFGVDLDGDNTENAVMEDFHEAVKHRIRSAPTLFINHILFDGPPTEETLRTRIDELLNCLTENSPLSTAKQEL